MDFRFYNFKALKLILTVLFASPFISNYVLATNYNFEDLIETWAYRYANAMGAEQIELDYSELEFTPGQQYWENIHKTGVRYILAKEKQKYTNNDSEPVAQHFSRTISETVNLSWQVSKGFKEGINKSIQLNIPVPYSTAAFQAKGEKTHEYSLNRTDQQQESRVITRTVAADKTVRANSTITATFQIEGDETLANLITPYTIKGRLRINMGPKTKKLSENYHTITHQKLPIGLYNSVNIGYDIGEIFYQGEPYLNESTLTIFPGIMNCYPNENQYYQLVDNKTIIYKSQITHKFYTDFLEHLIID